MMFAIATAPAFLFAIAAAWLAFWVLNIARDLRPVPALVSAMTILVVVQLGLALVTMGLTEQNRIGRFACLSGSLGMFVNAGLFVLEAVALSGVALFARARLARVGGAKLPIAMVLVSWLAAVIHMRSALLCTV